jgi:transcription elongation factor GreB
VGENGKRQRDKKRFCIAGSAEIIGAKDYISIDSPMAHALEKRSGDGVVVKTGAGEFVWRVNQN